MQRLNKRIERKLSMFPNSLSNDTGIIFIHQTITFCTKSSNIVCFLSDITAISVVPIQSLKSDDLQPPKSEVTNLMTKLYTPRNSISIDKPSDTIILTRRLSRHINNFPALQLQLNNSEIKLTKNDDVHQTTRHTFMLILLLCAMFVGLSLAVWTLVMEGMSGIYLELVYLDGFLNFGQSIIVLCCFFTNTIDLFMPLVKKYRQMRYGVVKNESNLQKTISAETQQICDQFKTYHLHVCAKEIAKDKRWCVRLYQHVFCGSVFIDWVLRVGLATDRVDAIEYATHLLDGRVMKPINNKVACFSDTNILYSF